MSGADIVIRENIEGFFDFEIDENGDMKSEDFFDTAIYMSVYCERRAEESEMLNPISRRGWIGNLETEGFEIGSKIWLHHQDRLNRASLNSVVTETENCLQWLIDDGHALSTRVSGQLTPTSMKITAIIERPTGIVEHRFSDFWDNTGK